MSFSNPAGRAREAAAGYVRALLDVLGDRDPFAVQAELLPALASLLDGLDDATLRKPEKPGKWSIIEVVQHLADSEVVYAWRHRMMLSAPEPEIQGFDQDAWARELRYRDADLDEALDQLRVLRRANLRLLRSLDDARLRRFGRHAERGEESVDRTMRLTAAHDLVHRAQIARIRRAVTSG